MSNFYKNKHVLITGGAGFIGSALTDSLISSGSITTIADNLSSGSIQNIYRIWKKNGLAYKKTSYGYRADNGHKFLFVNLEEQSEAKKALKNQEIIFHLAATIGGRGYIDTHQADCCESFAINQNIIKAAFSNTVDRLFFASSACVYPQDLQNKYRSTYLLKEEDAIKNNWANADREYGWAKLMGEITLQAYHKQYHLKGSITRYVTAYGPWENDTHAIIALIRRAVEKQDPYLIWGSGKQDRDFTYIDDIVSGTLAACEKITNCEAVNLGTAKRYTLVEVVKTIFKILDWQPEKLIFDTSKPEGVKTRALSIIKAKRVLQWEPRIKLAEGLQKTIEWFIKEKPKQVESIK
jgi:UDP-glucose 4-epimerase